MPTLKRFQTIESKIYPGVRFRIRTLNVIERARRDAQISEHRIEYSRLSIELDTVKRKLIGEAETEFTAAIRKELQKLELPLDHPVTLGLARWCSVQQVEERFDALPEAERHKMEKLQVQQEQVYQLHILPATIRAALVGIEGLTVDGKDVTVDDVLSDSPDDLLEEIASACLSASGLIEADAKN